MMPRFDLGPAERQRIEEAKVAAERAAAERAAAQAAAEARSYPFTFQPLLKKTIWGGAAICLFKDITPEEDGVGESWEVSHVANHYSVVSNGLHEGKTLDELILRFGTRLTGKKPMKKLGNTFPLLVKFIDAEDDLSVQVHPNDDLAKERHQSFGKTEMWYVIHAAPEAAIYVGLTKTISEEELQQRIKDNTIMDVLQRYQVSAGDVFFLPAGRIHAIGAGCFLAEIQQTSDITYRLYDYNRIDARGEHRELHVQEALAAIDYTCLPDYRTSYKPKKNAAVNLVQCPYFTTNLLDIDTPIIRNFSHKDSFIIYICMAGEILLQDNMNNTTTMRRGQTALVPAETESLILSPSPFGAKLLETYIG